MSPEAVGVRPGLTPERRHWIAGYRDGWAGKSPPDECSYPYQLGWTAGNTDRLIGVARPAFAPLVEGIKKGPPGGEPSV